MSTPASGTASAASRPASTGDDHAGLVAGVPEAGRLAIEVSTPFRLDLAVWTLRRRAHNAVDRFDGHAYRRVCCLAGQPVEVTVRQQVRSGTPLLTVELRGPGGPPGPAAAALVRTILDRMLGLTADLAGFYEVAERDDQLRALALRFRGMRPPCFPTVFEALINAVACQQLSLDVGIHLLNRVARRFGPAVPGTGSAQLYGFPEPDRIAAVPQAELRELGFNGAKARTITTIAAQVAAGDLDLEALRGVGDDAARETLLGLPGIGRWSTEYVLLRGLARYHVQHEHQHRGCRHRGQELQANRVGDADRRSGQPARPVGPHQNGAASLGASRRIDHAGPQPGRAVPSGQRPRDRRRELQAAGRAGCIV